MWKPLCKDFSVLFIKDVIGETIEGDIEDWLINALHRSTDLFNEGKVYSVGHTQLGRIDVLDVNVHVSRGEDPVLYFVYGEGTPIGNMPIEVKRYLINLCCYLSEVELVNYSLAV